MGGDVLHRNLFQPNQLLQNVESKEPETNSLLDKVFKQRRQYIEENDDETIPWKKKEPNVNPIENVNKPIENVKRPKLNFEDELMLKVKNPNFKSINEKKEEVNKTIENVKRPKLSFEDELMLKVKNPNLKSINEKKEDATKKNINIPDSF